MAKVATCPKCESWIDDRQRDPSCLSCGVLLPESVIEKLPNVRVAPRTAAEHMPEAGTRPASAEKTPGDIIVRRYVDAYGIARGSVNLGNGIKVLGVILGGAAVFASIAASSSGLGRAALFVGIVLAFGLGSTVYGIGTHIAAQGQMLLATLDTAVNTSPLLNNEQKARALSL